MKITETTPHKVALEELGRRVALARKNKRMNQSEMARASGLGVATIARIETGQDAQFSSWLKIFGVLGLTAALDQLVPESLTSPMSEVQRGRRQRRMKTGEFKWGDEQS
jgi:transcriptional regulator with XRE-family HTH domain